MLFHMGICELMLFPIMPAHGLCQRPRLLHRRVAGFQVQSSNRIDISILKHNFKNLIAFILLLWIFRFCSKRTEPFEISCVSIDAIFREGHARMGIVELTSGKMKFAMVDLLSCSGLSFPLCFHSYTSFYVYKVQRQVIEQIFRNSSTHRSP